MALSQATLADQLEALAPTDSVPGAIAALVDAYATYAAGAQAASPLLPAGVTLGRTAMTTALSVGAPNYALNAPGGGAAVLATGIQAFWAGVAGGLATSFAAAVAIVPPCAGLTPAALQAAFTAATAGSQTAAQAAAALAAIIHPLTAGLTGGGSVSVGAPPVPTRIA